MPELPEVETVRRGLASLVSGATVDSVEIRRESCVRLTAGGAPEFAAALIGSTLRSVARRGKFLWMPLGEDAAARGADPTQAAEALSAHLGMSGQFRVHQAAPGEAPEPHRHCRARLGLRRDGDRLTLDFLDQRTFGYLRVEPLRPTADGLPGGEGTAAAAVPGSVTHIARDVLDPVLDEPAVLEALRRGSRGVKQVLLDQRVVSGVGNIYADEALWRAGVHPERPAEGLAEQEAAGLLAALREVMTAALAAGGTSFDALYVNVNGESGYFARGLEAYGRAGRPCRRCGTPLERARIGQRGTHWCPRCQPRQPGGASRMAA